MRRKNLEEGIFGQWIVLGYDNNKSKWKCVCTCGNIGYHKTNTLTSGNTKSCGCYRNEYISIKNSTHGKSKTKLYHVYATMKARCYKEWNHKYKSYGGRGIKICDEWLINYETFYNWAVDNGYDDKLTIDRINNDGNYEPNNCRWVDNKTQAQNTRQNRYIEYNGETKTITGWSEELKIKRKTLEFRLKQGWSIKRAFTEKVIIGKNQHTGGDSSD